MRHPERSSGFEQEMHMNEKRRSLLGDPLDQYNLDDEHNKKREQTGDEQPDSEDQNGREEEKDSSFRRMDTGLGQPDPAPGPEAEMSDVSAEEIEELRREQEKLRRQFEEKLLELEQTGIKIPRAVFRFVMWAAIFLAAVLGLFIINQGVRFAVQIQALSVPWNILAISGTVLFSAVILVVTGKLIGKFLALRSMTRIDLKALNLLSERRRYRYLAEQKKEEAKEVLAGYLKDYKLDDREGSALGLDKQDIVRLHSHRRNLLDSSGYADSAHWLKELDETFVHILDRTARKRIRTYTRAVALGTAASPIRFIDQMIVFYASLKLISELTQIYSLRPAMGQSVTILARSIIQAYLSGLIGEHAEAGVDTLGDYYENIFGEISLTTGISAATDAARFIMPKAGEGALNGFLVWRLGKHAQKMIRPL